LSGVCAASPQELVTRSHFEDAPHVPAGSNRYDEITDGGAENRVIAVFEPETVVLVFFVPLDEVNHEIDALSFAHAGDAEELFDVEDAEAADLDMVPEKIGRLSEDHSRRSPVASHDVVGNESVVTHHELERTLAFSDAALAEKQDADTEYVDENAVELRVRREPVVEECVERVDGAERPSLTNSGVDVASAAAWSARAGS
jgi:hypothetical protein